MTWVLMDLPFGYTKDTYFPGSFQESISIDKVIECAYFDTLEYLGIYPNALTLGISHFNEHPVEDCIIYTTEILTDDLYALYSGIQTRDDINRTLCDQVAPVYDSLKEIFYGFLIRNTRDKSVKNVYMSWVSNDTFIIIEENERVAMEGISLDFPFITDLVYLGVSV